MSGPVIETPRGFGFVGKTFKAKLNWNTNFGPTRQRQFSAAQKFVDREVLSLSEPYVPLLTGTLIKTGIIGTVIGSGIVSWIAPYARNRYFTPRKSPSMTGDQRGPFWFHRMLAVWKNYLVAGVKKRAGGRK